MPIPLFVWGIAALGSGFIGGAASRQPEINNLTEQVNTLQREVDRLKKEVERLQRLVSEQNRQINVLVIKYHTMKGIHIIEKSKAKNHAKGAIMYTYCLKEYLDLKNDVLSKDYSPSDEESAFMESFFMVLEGSLKATPEDFAKKQYIKEYIRKKYSSKIDSLVECQLQNTLNRIGVSC